MSMTCSRLACALSIVSFSGGLLGPVYRQNPMQRNEIRYQLHRVCEPVLNGMYGVGYNVTIERNRCDRLCS
jgi:hypothetical protein